MTFGRGGILVHQCLPVISFNDAEVERQRELTWVKCGIYNLLRGP